MNATPQRSALPISAPSSRLLAWAVAADEPSFDTGWTKTGQHKLVYAASGVLHLQVGDAQWLLPPQRAAWLRAGVEHRLHASEPVSLRIVHLSASLADAPPVEVGLFEVVPLAREMILEAVRWGADRNPEDERANRFFLAFAAMLDDWVGRSRTYRLPVARTPELQRAMAFAMEHLNEEPTIEDAARLAGVSPRTLARRFRDDAGTTWREFLHDARMMKAMELLADPNRSVTETAYAVGFNSLGAFTRAFVDFTGERPRDYHRRATDIPE